MPRFSNLDGPTAIKGITDVLKWQLGLGPGPRLRSPSRAAVPFVANDGKALQGAPIPSVTWIGHATFLVQLAGKSILTDPILSDRLFMLGRNVPPGLTYATLPRIDAVVLSHNHRDHMDAPTLKRLGPEVQYFVPQGLGDWFRRQGLRRVTEMAWWQTERVGKVNVTFVPAQHWSRRALNDTNETLWGGFVLEDGSGAGNQAGNAATDGARGGTGAPARADVHRVYHSGDTAYFSGFRTIGERCGPIAAALLPIGAYAPRWFMQAQHMNPADAIQAFIDLGAARMVAMHWGTFKLTDEPLDEPPRLAREIWAEKQLDPARLCVPAIGETLAL